MIDQKSNKQTKMRKNKQDKDMRTNILKLVANRIKPVDQTIHCVRTSCNSCIVKALDTHNGKSKTNQSMTGEDKIQIVVPKKMLKLESNLYCMNFKGEKTQVKEIESPRKMLIMISKKSTQSTTEKCNNNQTQNYTMQTVKQHITHWVNFTLQKSRKYSGDQQSHKQNLPLEQEPDMKALKQKITQAFDLRVFETKDSKLSYSQSINSSVFKKSIKAPPMMFESSPECTDREKEGKQASHKLILDHESPPKQFKLMPSREQSGSLKLLKSVSTIASEKNIIKMGEQSYDELMRMLHIQALTIEEVIHESKNL